MADRHTNIRWGRGAKARPQQLLHSKLQLTERAQGCRAPTRHSSHRWALLPEHSSAPRCWKAPLFPQLPHTTCTHTPGLLPQCHVQPCKAKAKALRQPQPSPMHRSSPAARHEMEPAAIGTRSPELLLPCPPCPSTGEGLLVQKLARPINLMRFCSQGLLSARKGTALQSERAGGSGKLRGFGTVKHAGKARSFCCSPSSSKKGLTPSPGGTPESRGTSCS